jgi:hypothetical protein
MDVLRTIVNLVAVGGTASSSLAQAPKIVNVSNSPSCAQCKIVLTKAVTLGTPDDPEGPIDPHFFLSRSSDGRYYLGEQSEMNRFVFVYDERGRFERTIGRPGGGPGEFSVISGVATRGNEVLVWEPGGKYAMFDRRGNLIRDGRFPFTPKQLMPSPEIGWVGWADVRTARLSGLFFHEFDHELRYLRSRPGAKTKLDPAEEVRRQFHMIPLESGYAALSYTFKSVEFFDAKGATTRLLRLNSPWLSLEGIEWRNYKPMHGGPEYRAPVTPPPRLNAIAIDSRGLLWVLGAVEDRSWRKLGREFRGPNAPKLSPGWFDTVWDSIIEIIDPSTGNLVHRERLPFYAESFLGRDVLIRGTEDAAGFLRLELWKTELVGWRR